MKKATNIKNGNVNIKCEYCGGCGYHKMSCPTQKVTVFLSDEEMEVKHLINDVYQVVQNGTVWFQGDLLDCHAYKNKSLSHDRRD